MRTWTGRIVLLGLLAALPWTMGADGSATALEALSGMGIAQTFGCIACVGGGVALLGSGWGMVTAFIWSSGSLVALGGCIALCADVVM